MTDTTVQSIAQQVPASLAHELRIEASLTQHHATHARLTRMAEDAHRLQTALLNAEQELATLRAAQPEYATLTSGWEAKMVDVLGEVVAERRRQEAKWGQQNHPDIPPLLRGTRPTLAFCMPSAIAARNNCERDFKGGCGSYAAIFVEEVCEALDDAADPVKLRTELVQVAAVAVAWIEKIDRDATKGED